MCPVVRTRRRAHDGQHGLGIRDELHLRMDAHQQRTQVHRCAVPIGRKEFEVVLHAQFAHPDEKVCRRFRHAQITRRPLHARRILVGTEDHDASVFLGKRLQSLEAGDRVMEDLREGVERERECLGRLGRRPLTVLEAGKDHGPGPVGVEAQRIPIDL